MGVKLSTKKKDYDESAKVLGKLDKVADSLENTTNHLSGVVTQQQLDLVRERIIRCETDSVTSKDGMEILVKRTAAHAEESVVMSSELDKKIDFLEREFAGLRALTISAFALATISLMGLIVVSIL